MTNDFIFAHVDHTLLKAFATWQDIRKLCEEAERYHMASVCVPSSFVKKIRQEFPHLTICTVVGFPLGNCSTEAKAAETEAAIRDGADEIDMVIHIGALKEGNLSYVTHEIAALKKAAGSHILKKKKLPPAAQSPKGERTISKPPPALAVPAPLWKM